MKEFLLKDNDLNEDVNTKNCCLNSITMHEKDYIDNLTLVIKLCLIKDIRSFL